MAQVLIVEDEVNVLKMTQMMLSRAGHAVTGFPSGKDAISAILKAEKSDEGLSWDVVLTDYRLGDATGIDVLKAVKRVDASTQVLLVTAYATTQTAVEAMKLGAYDYIEKPFKRDEILALIDKASARRQSMRGRLRDRMGGRQIVGDSPQIIDMLDMISRVAPTKANILINGESGTGKEVVARTIHELSGVKGAFVPVNCGAIPETLVESEFFGYTKGAFTGATKDKTGYFQAAEGGTLFLDEIGELPLQMQVKLLRAIQEKKIQPVGSAQEIKVSVRIIAATNRDLRAEVDARRFREDLFFRLNVIQVSLPALRERRSDIPLFIAHFIDKFNEELGKSIEGVDADVRRVLMNYDYRGNVRELENIIEHAVTLETGAQIGIQSLPAYLRNSLNDIKPSQPALKPTERGDRGDEIPSGEEEAFDPEILAQVKVGDGIELEGVVENLERSLIEQSLEKTNGNKTEAAKLLGISFRSMRYRLKKYGLE